MGLICPIFQNALVLWKKLPKLSGSFLQTKNMWSSGDGETVQAAYQLGNTSSRMITEVKQR